MSRAREIETPEMRHWASVRTMENALVSLRKAYWSHKEYYLLEWQHSPRGQGTDMHGVDTHIWFQHGKTENIYPFDIQLKSSLEHMQAHLAMPGQKVKYCIANDSRLPPVEEQLKAEFTRFIDTLQVLDEGVRKLLHGREMGVLKNKARGQKNKQTVFAYLDENPMATAPEIAKATGLCLATCSKHRAKWYEVHPEYGRPHKLNCLHRINAGLENQKKVFAYMDENPQASALDASRATGLKLGVCARSLSKWRELHPEFRRVPGQNSTELRLKNQRLIFSYLEKDPKATDQMIAEATGLSRKTCRINRKIWQEMNHLSTKYLNC